MRPLSDVDSGITATIATFPDQDLPRWHCHSHLPYLFLSKKPVPPQPHSLGLISTYSGVFPVYAVPGLMFAQIGNKLQHSIPITGL